ncbi:hypothetical protein [Streptomyces sp. AC558_RSS880]|uniref:hypothetical protein n=1 Tax=Streptomyces sp. AC558_RSS880 TaxID=2823687 RepID=UPI001C246DAF|nr:hypothetical protein [Streptomyces sp. AC558_RSS880]
MTAHPPVTGHGGRLRDGPRASYAALPVPGRDSGTHGPDAGPRAGAGRRARRGAGRRARRGAGRAGRCGPRAVRATRRHRPAAGARSGHGRAG